jgi:hypothetical protein
MDELSSMIGVAPLEILSENKGGAGDDDDIGGVGVLFGGNEATVLFASGGLLPRRA